MAYLIGIDVGTSGTKTVLFTETGEVFASHTVEYPLYQPQNGYAEQDPADWWNATVTGLKTGLFLFLMFLRQYLLSMPRQNLLQCNINCIITNF